MGPRNFVKAIGNIFGATAANEKNKGRKNAIAIEKKTGRTSTDNDVKGEKKAQAAWKTSREEEQSSKRGKTEAGSARKKNGK